ncbi:MSHA biogenesis protein MshQ [Duganella sp. 1224]|uniref:DUF6701 domain-containing protein n=1 Tax=Duganella sp. 1224 TaxID=2587052 RepID=UPI0015CE4EEC|nr:MSHA biogenesis protein MshQ [Duganella sp. 1224]
MAAAAALAGLMLAGAAHGANLNFNGSNTVPICPLSGSTYTCATLPLGANDSAVISSGYTVIVNTGVALSYGQGLVMSGSAALQVNGSLDLSASNGLNVSGGTLTTSGNFKLGASAQSITANVNAATLTTAGSSTYIGGTVTTSGDINLGSNSTITGAVTSTGGSISTGSSTTLGPLTVKGSVNLSSSNTINGSVSATSITTNSSVTINGSITLDKNNTSSVADLGSGIKVTGNVSAYSVKTNSPGTINGSIDAKTTIDLGSSITVGGLVSGTTVTTNSPVTLNGGVNATVSFTLGSGSSVTGNIVSPVVTLNASNITVKGNVTATTSLDMGSGTAITGTVNTGGLTMRASNAVINGTTTVNGDVDMGSGSTINGDLTARNVNTRASNAVINGNAAVNAIYIDWGNSVTKTITCTGPGAVLCSCVTKADPNYRPTCGASAPTGPDHIQITHDGKGMTCEPAAVKLRACANSDCSVAYTGSTTVTLKPGGGQVTFTGDANATVSQSSAGTTQLSAGTGTTCVNTSTGTNSSNDANACNMTFSANGLIMSAPDHVSMTPAALSIQIKKAAPDNAFCVPLAQGSATLNFSCKYSDPASGTQRLTLGNGGAQGLCNGGNIPVNVSFDASGQASVPMQYPDVGLVNVTSAYSANGVDVAGSASFTAAPAKFLITATTDPAVTLGGTSTNGSAIAFARSGDPFRLTVAALNAANPPTVTPNFGKEKSAESFAISPIVLKLPSDGNNPPATIGSFGSILNGVGASTAGQAGLWTYTETGVITLNAKLSNSSSYYMGKTALNAFRTTGTLDLRFAPHHFDVVLLPGVPMNCSYVGGYSNPCKADSSNNAKFVYSGQPFAVQAKAYKDATTLSANYRLRTPGRTDTEDVARSITLSAAVAAGGNLSGGFVANTASNFIFATDANTGAGTGVATIIAVPPAVTPTLPSLRFSATEPPYSAPTTIYLRLTDTDGASSSRTGSAEPPLTIVRGKMLISNAYGPLNTPLPVEARAMYWSSDAGAWLFNSAFTPQSPALGAAAALQTSDGTFTGCTGSLNCGALSLRATTLQFKNGKTMFQIAPQNASGTVKVRLKQSGNATSPLFMDNNFPYLPIMDDSTVTFGTSRPGPVIYTREVYN